jgi:hypothetical protein
MYDCVVVNLDRRGDRWMNTLLRLIAAGLPCSRLPAADGSKHSAAALLQARELILVQFCIQTNGRSSEARAAAVVVRR